MAGKYRILCRGNTSAMAIAASVASVFWAPTAALACSWVPSGGGVSIVCPPGDPAAAPFMTSYNNDSTGYDGNQADTLDISGGTIAPGGQLPSSGSFELDPSDDIELLGGDDVVTMSGGVVSSSLFAGDGNDSVTMSGGTISGGVYAGAGNDVVSISGGAISSGVYGGAGDDSITISGGTITAGPPTFITEALVVGPIVDPAVSGGSGDDSISVTGGTINGDVDAEHVHLSGGTITGDITGISPTSLIIDNVGTVDPLNLRDGVIFSGTGANAQITDVDLAAGGTKRQNFLGFNNVLLNNSTLAFAPGSNQEIALLSLTNGSTLFSNGNVGVTGTLSVVNSTLSMINGAADGVLTLGGLVLNNATIGLDVNQQAHQADRLVAGTFSSTGNNIINVNLVGPPDFSGVTEIPIIVSAGGPAGGTFSITGIPGTVGSFFDYQVLPGAGGGLFIRATPLNFGVVSAPDSAVNGSIVDVAIDALYGINRDALDADLGLANGMARVAGAPSFGVFASGQFAHTDHSGYEVSTGSAHGPGPSFDAEDFSAAISVDFNAAKHFQLDTQYGLNFGLFAGYASTDVQLNPFLGFTNVGSGTNKSGMFGGYALFRKSTTYALVSAATFIGGSDIYNGMLNSTGKYDTKGYAVTGSVGRIFMLSDRTRFDLRGGLLGVSFTGDGYTDSVGNVFGDSRISFGAVQFAPGIYGDYKLSNDMVFSPYARLELQQRIGASNTTNIGSRKIDFDDADFSTAASAGFNLKMTDATTLSGELRGKWSADSSTVGGKIGLKVAF